ncbi:MAG TPA: 4Fe-4S binding protein [Candidatus Deferrimicrobium sp.]|nr:4Fe-4S binding protein [Candidatus Deferrimicrobium sp.]
MSITWVEKTKRRYLLDLILKLAVKTPEIIEVPEELKGFGTIIYDSAKCIACGSCTRMCEDTAIILDNLFDLKSLDNLPKDSNAKNRILLAEFIKKLKRKEPENPIEIPKGLLGIGTINLNLSKCIACKECVRICEYEALSFKPEWNLKEILENFQKN